MIAYPIALLVTYLALFIPALLLATYGGARAPWLFPMAFLAGCGVATITGYLYNWTWLRWNVVCRRGRRCARVEVVPEDTPPPGVLLVAHYMCGRCGTCYETTGIGHHEKVAAP